MSTPSADAQSSQIMLKLQYRDLARRPADLPSMNEVEFRCYSQNGEDGILLYLFSLLGTSNRRAVEICAGDGIECNAANLIINHGWRGLLVDGDAALVERGKSFYATCRNTFVSPPTMVNAWITRETVAGLVDQYGFGGPLDLLSLDLDGNDYWIWKALDNVAPRVVVLEFNAGCGPDASVAMSYRADYRLDLTKQPYRCGASLQAFTELASKKGYRLVGIQSLGFNAFFVQRGLGEDLLPERSVRQCYEENERLRQWEPSWLKSIMAGDERWETV